MSSVTGTIIGNRMPAHEFELIAQILHRLGEDHDLVLGPGDDCALAELPSGCLLASSIDSFFEGRHFPLRADPWLIAQRCFRAALSDLAAMGAKPLLALLSLSLPDANQPWLEGFADGIRAAASRFKCPIAGGNLSCGELGVTLSVHGSVPTEGSLTRSGAEAGQDIFVSGVLGGAAAALEHIDEVRDRVTLLAVTGGVTAHPLNRYWLPEPRLDLGRALIGKASAAIDISDGLYGDAWHLAQASQVGLCFAAEVLPLAGDVGRSDDYELLFTAPASLRAHIESLGEAEGVRVTRVGETSHRTGVWRGSEFIRQDTLGYRHFG